MGFLGNRRCGDFGTSQNASRRIKELQGADRESAWVDLPDALQSEE